MIVALLMSALLVASQLGGPVVVEEAEVREKLLRMALFHATAAGSGSWVVAILSYSGVARKRTMALLLLMTALAFPEVSVKLGEVEEVVVLGWVVLKGAPMPTAYLAARWSGLGVAVEALGQQQQQALLVASMCCSRMLQSCRFELSTFESND